VEVAVTAAIVAIAAMIIAPRITNSSIDPALALQRSLNEAVNISLQGHAVRFRVANGKLRSAILVTNEAGESRWEPVKLGWIEKVEAEWSAVPPDCVVRPPGVVSSWRVNVIPPGGNGRDLCVTVTGYVFEITEP